MLTWLFLWLACQSSGNFCTIPTAVLPELNQGSVFIDTPPKIKMKCRHGHVWFGQPLTFRVYIGADADEGILICPYCLRDFVKSHFGAERAQ